MLLRITEERDKEDPCNTKRGEMETGHEQKRYAKVEIKILDRSLKWHIIQDSPVF